MESLDKSLRLLKPLSRFVDDLVVPLLAVPVETQERFIAKNKATGLVPRRKLLGAFDSLDEIGDGRELLQSALASLLEILVVNLVFHVTILR
jgi:hypothetical protein